MTSMFRPAGKALLALTARHCITVPTDNTCVSNIGFQRHNFKYLNIHSTWQIQHLVVDKVIKLLWGFNMLLPGFFPSQ